LVFLVCFAFHRGTARNLARYNAESLEIMRTADYTDVTDETDDKNRRNFLCAD
jgi:hypothetical protein